MVLKYIRLKDFQSHEDNTVTFDPLFNIIVGPSGTGKSSIIRALEYLAFNNIGINEVRWPDAKFYHLELGINDDVIIREKGSGVNSYQINQDSALIDVNKDVPEAVTKVLGIKKVKLDDKQEIDVQFAGQLDAPFMLAVPDSVKIKFLNTLSGTSAVDLAAKESANKVRESTRNIKELKAKLDVLLLEEEQLKDQLELVSKANRVLTKKQRELAELCAMKVPLHAAKRRNDFLVQEYKRLRIVKENCSRLDLEALTDKIEQYNQFTNLKHQADVIFSSWEGLAERKGRVSRLDCESVLSKLDSYITLTNLLNKRNQLKDQYLHFKDKVKHLNAVNTESISNLASRYETMCSAKGKWDQHIQDVQAHKKQKDRLNAEYSSAAAMYKEELVKNQVCPVCGNALSEDCVDKVLKTL